MFLTVAVITPLTYTAYLGQPPVRFQCTTANARSVVWNINDLILQHDELEAQGIETMTNHALLESNLTISSTVGNNNTRIRCLVRHLVEHRYVASEVVLFHVQGQQPKHTDTCCSVMVDQATSVILCSSGLLGKCPGLQIILSGNYHQCLTWDPPSTLNITAVEPDISSYTVCNNISTECTTINVTEGGGDSSDLRKHVFPNLRTYINFTVIAVNIVGDGESASIVYDPCEHTEGGECI